MANTKSMNDWVKVITFTYSHEALLAKSMLESCDIGVLIRDELTIQVHPLLSNAIGGVKLLVHVNQAEEALILLEDSEYIVRNASKQKTKIEAFSTKYKHICPYCKSDNMAKKYIPGNIFILSYIAFSLPIPTLKKRYHCYDCSKEWKVRSWGNNQD